MSLHCRITVILISIITICQLMISINSAMNIHQIRHNHSDTKLQQLPSSLLSFKNLTINYQTLLYPIFIHNTPSQLNHHKKNKILINQLNIIEVVEIENSEKQYEQILAYHYTFASSVYGMHYTYFEDTFHYAVDPSFDFFHHSSAVSFSDAPICYYYFGDFSHEFFLCGAARI